MKKKLLLVTAAAFMAFGAIGYTGSRFLFKENPVVVKAAASSESIDLSKGVGEGSGTGYTITWNGASCSIKQEKGKSSTSVSSSYISAPRWYQSHVISFKANEGYTISKVTVVCTSNAYATALKDSTYTNGASAKASTSTVTISASGDFDVTMGAQSRISSISVEYTEEGGSKTLEINSANDYSKVGDTLQLSVSGTAELAGVSWRLNNASGIATISNSGLITPTGYGIIEAVATSTDGTVSEAKEIKIYPNNATEISIPLAREICDLAGSTASPYSYKLSAEVFDIGEGWNEQYGNITFDLWDDEANAITCFRAKGYSGIDVEDKIQVTGNLLKYNDTYEFASGCTYLKYHTVMFNNDGNQYGDDFEVLDGSKIAKPNDPVKSGYTFNGWLDEDDNLWDFNNDTVSDDMILTASWSDAAEASLQNDLDNINSWMSLSYKYTDTKVTNSSTIVIDENGDNYGHTGNSGITKDMEIDLTSDFSNSDGLVFTMNTNDSTYLYINENKSVNVLRLYASEEIVISSTTGSVFEVQALGRNDSVLSSLNITYSNGTAKVKNTATSGNIEIVGFNVEYGSGGMENVDFRLRMATDNMDEFASMHTVASYGIEVRTGSKTKSFAYNSETYVDDETSNQYVVIGLGDVFANPDRLTEKFTIRAYAVSGGKTFYSTKSKSLNVIDLVKTYHEMETTSELVEPLYDYLTTLGYID